VDNVFIYDVDSHRGHAAIKLGAGEERLNHSAIRNNRLFADTGARPPMRILR